MLKLLDAASRDVSFLCNNLFLHSTETNIPDHKWRRQTNLKSTFLIILDAPKVVSLYHSSLFAIPFKAVYKAVIFFSTDFIACLFDDHRVSECPFTVVSKYGFINSHLSVVPLKNKICFELSQRKLSSLETLLLHVHRPNLSCVLHRVQTWPVHLCDWCEPARHYKCRPC